MCDGDPDTASDFVDSMDDADLWEVLNAQADLIIHLHTQIIRFLQILLTLLGLLITGIAVLGTSAIASSLSPENLDTMRTNHIPTTGLLVFLFIFYHSWGTVRNGGFLSVSVIPRLTVLGVDFYPARGDRAALESGKAEGVRSNAATIGALGEELSNMYSHLVGLSLHAVTTLLLWHGVLHLDFTLLYGLWLSVTIVLWETIYPVFMSEDGAMQKLRTRTRGEEGLRFWWDWTKELYKQADEEADTLFGKARGILGHTRESFPIIARFFLIMAHGMFWVLFFTT